MSMVLRGLDFVHCYIDDILVASSSEEEHKTHLRKLFEKLRNYGLTINVAKSVFGKAEINYLGYKISAADTKSIPERVKAIRNIHDHK